MKFLSRPHASQILAGLAILVASITLASAGEPRLYFFTQAGCPPCAQIHPTVAEFAKTHATSTVDAAQYPDWFAKYHVTGTPCCVMTSDGATETARISGNQPLASLLAIWNAGAGKSATKDETAETSQPGPPKQICLIDCDAGSSICSGSGTLVWSNGPRAIVITNHHVISHGGAITCKFPGGGTSKAAVIDKEPINDLAALLLDSPGIDPLFLSDAGPYHDERVWIAGYPRGQMANFEFQAGTAGNYRSDPETKQANWFGIQGAAAKSGESGGPVLDENGTLVGVLWGGGGQETTAVNSKTVKAFLARAASVVPQTCGGVGVGVGIFAGRQPDGRNVAQGQPLPSKSPTATAPPFVSAPAPQPTPALTASAADLQNLTGRVDSLEKAVAAIPAGPAGPAGPQGPKGDPGAPATQPIAPASPAPLAASPSAPSTPAGPTLSHFVLVADQAADYWPRLSSELSAAQQKFSKIVPVDSKQIPFGVQLPQLVAFDTAGNPLSDNRGQRDVESALQKIQRGEL